ncbi:MAG: PBP1A family penicillin-binding protein [Proteobacteria bacterium]|nr:PBP1A family penicillin-binding protein [Pseudomonadota bacterium]
MAARPLASPSRRHLTRPPESWYAPGTVTAASRSNRRRTAPLSAERRRTGAGRQPSRSLRRLFGALLKWGSVGAIWVVILLGLVIGYEALQLPDTSGLEQSTRKPAIRLAAADGATFASFGEYYGKPIAVAELPKALPDAVIATEDRRFWRHYGVDPLGLARALWVNLAHRGIRQGGSTITQQLAKNLFLTPERSLARKIQELLLAFSLERRFTKDEILTVYLNRVYLGAGAFGVSAAAERYFGKEANELNLYESALIAGLLKAPSRYSPAASPERSRERTRQVLANMVVAGYITQAAAAAAEHLPVGRGNFTMAGAGSRYFADWILDQVGDYVGAPTSDLTVITTIDPVLQRIAEAAVEAALAKSGSQRNVGEAALVALGPDGAVKAMVGGRDYRESQFNRATQALRQPGSAFKPFVYLAGLEAGITAEQIFQDSPFSIGGWSPANFDRRFRGPISVSEAFAQSINTVAVAVSERVGRRRVIEAARRLGITAALEDAPSLALGTSEVTLIELTQAYGAFATGGEGVWAHGIEEIRDAAGQVLYRRSGGGPGRVIEPGPAAEMTRLMTGVIDRGTGRSAKLDRPAAGKTGTSQSFRDALFVGFTADLIAGVWLGNDDGQAMKAVTGGNLPAELWSAFMREADRGRPIKPLVVPPQPQTSFILPWLTGGPARTLAPSPPVPSAAERGFNGPKN